jgi:hypothetical protein
MNIVEESRSSLMKPNWPPRLLMSIYTGRMPNVQLSSNVWMSPRTIPPRLWRPQNNERLKDKKKKLLKPLRVG